MLNLSDPEVLAAAVSKANAVARTLFTSNGKSLDVTTTGQVSATLDNVQANAEFYREVFTSEDLLSSPTRLGLLSRVSGNGLSDVQPWMDDKIPRINDAVILTRETVASINASIPFKLDPRSKDLIRELNDLRPRKTLMSLANRDQYDGRITCVTGFTKNNIRLYPDSSAPSKKKIKVAGIEQLTNGNCLKINAEKNMRLQVTIAGQRWWVKKSKAIQNSDPTDISSTACTTILRARKSAVRGAGACTQ